MADNFRVIIVTYNNEKTIKDCLDSVLNKSKVSITVVDNASTDKTCLVVESYGDKVKLIKQSENLGFSKSNNIAVKDSKEDVLIFLNPDTKALGDKLKELVKVLIGSGYGLIGPKLVYKNGEIQKSVRNLPTIFGAINEYILGVKGAYDFYEPLGEDLCEVESVVGACMVIKRDLFLKIGGFDEKFFLYYEDLELCRQIRNKGFKIGYFPKILVTHLVGQSGEGQKTANYNLESAKKYHGFLEFYLIQLILRLGYQIGRIKK